MAGNYVEFEMSEFKTFFNKLQQAAKSDFRNELVLFLEGIGLEFLRILGDEIIRRNTTDTRLLLASFQKGGDGNVWEMNEGGLSVVVGTNVTYAAFVNDGHWTNPKGTEVRFVPGTWQGDRFVYEPGAKTGMVLKQKWVEGSHYWESALRILEQMCPDILETKMQDWLDKYFM